MLAIGTRFFGKDPAKDLPRLDAFIRAAAQLGKVYVAINPEQDQTDALNFIQSQYGTSVEGFMVTPWGKFVPALNAIVYKAAIAGADHLLLASAEFPPKRDQVRQLMQHMDNETLVAGARFAEHAFAEGEVAGTGITVPWNTFALWKVSYLARLGFSLAGDAPFDPAKAGVEELVVTATYQTLFPELKIKLVVIPGFGGDWNTEGWDKTRLAKHRAKIASKIERPAAQLDWCECLQPPTIIHIS